MALTDPESFSQVTSPQVDESLLFEKEVESYDEAIQIINKRLDSWTNKDSDQDLKSYVDGLKEQIEQNKDKIVYNATMLDNSNSELSLREFKSEDSSEAIFIDIQTKLKNWVDSLSEGILKSTIKSVQKFMHENKDILSTSTKHIDSNIIPTPSKTYSLDEAQKTEQPYTNGTSEKSPDVVHSVGSNNDGKTLGAAPNEPSTQPLTNPSIKAEEVAVIAQIKPEGKNLYRKGEM
jgi:hypothetical protein